MYLSLDVEQHYVVHDVMDHCAFVSALPLLLNPTDIVVFGTYGSRSDVHAFLSVHEIEPDAFVLSARHQLQIWKDEYPNGTVFGLRADPAILPQLTALLGAKSEATDLCDHIVSYGAEFPILCFHDAFKSAPCYISSQLPKAKIEAFCSAIHRPWSLEAVRDPLV
jgi:hypothetical protein